MIIESDLRPVLSIVAVNDDIPHGLGNFGTAGVAEFWVTRSKVPSGEAYKPGLAYSALLKETNDQGKATDTIKHFAVDKDDQGDPICTITIVLQESDGCLLSGIEYEATVNVQGPDRPA